MWHIFTSSITQWFEYIYSQIYQRIYLTKQTIDGSMKSGVEKMNWIIFFLPAKAELFIVVLLLPRNQSHLLPAYVSSHVDQTE